MRGWFVRELSAAALSLAPFTGLALRVAVGFGTYIHSPIPLAMAWAWFIAATVKTFAAGLIVGLLLPENPRNVQAIDHQS